MIKIEKTHSRPKTPLSTPDHCMKIFDINLRQRFYNKEIIQQSMRHCNILKINDEELVTIGRMFGYPGLDIENKCWLILGNYDLDMLVLTNNWARLERCPADPFYLISDRVYCSIEKR